MANRSDKEAYQSVCPTFFFCQFVLSKMDISKETKNINRVRTHLENQIGFVFSAKEEKSLIFCELN